jgi:hypothetical protein
MIRNYYGLSFLNMAGKVKTSGKSLGMKSRVETKKENSNQSVLKYESKPNPPLSLTIRKVYTCGTSTGTRSVSFPFEPSLPFVVGQTVRAYSESWIF